MHFLEDGFACTFTIFKMFTVSPELFSKCQMVLVECCLNEVNLPFSRDRERQERWVMGAARERSV